MEVIKYLVLNSNNIMCQSKRDKIRVVISKIIKAIKLSFYKYYIKNNLPRFLFQSDVTMYDTLGN